MPYVANLLSATWRPLTLAGGAPELAERATARLEAELREWEGTPYAVGQQRKGAGADCVRFVAGVLDFLRGTSTELALLPDDAAFHSRARAVEAMLAFRRIFDPILPVDARCVEPGDVLVTGPPHGGPGHAILVGTKPAQLWEAGTGQVQQIGWSLPSRYKLFAVYRLGGREAWPT